MATHYTLFLLVLSAALGTGLPGAYFAQEPAAERAAPLTVRMEDCKTTRPARITSDTGILGLLFGLSTEELAKRGTLTVDGHKYTLYLPKAKTYTTKNAKADDSEFENTSTLITVDQQGNGRLTKEDGWFANLALRLGDKMFDVAEIAADGSQIVLRPSQSPQRGVIVGRQCPVFTFKTPEDKEISRERLVGKPFLLDIWSIT
jgi:hypothetical protein